MLKPGLISPPAGFFGFLLTSRDLSINQYLDERLGDLALTHYEADSGRLLRPVCWDRSPEKVLG
jgi:hypothetical protein